MSGTMLFTRMLYYITTTTDNQHNPILCYAAQCDAMLYPAMQHNAMLYFAMSYDSIRLHII
eukprot:14500208-Heterocapsa_arctica.AAC.1